MRTFSVGIFDIKDIESPKKLDDIQIKADTKSDAIDKAHSESTNMFPNIRLFLETREVTCSC